MCEIDSITSYAGRSAARHQSEHHRDARDRCPRPETESPSPCRACGKPTCKAGDGERNEDGRAKHGCPGRKVLHIAQAHATTTRPPPIGKLCPTTGTYRKQGKAKTDCRRSQGGGKRGLERATGLAGTRRDSPKLEREAEDSEGGADGVGNLLGFHVGHARSDCERDQRDHPSSSPLKCTVERNGRSKNRKTCVYQRSDLDWGRTRMVRMPARLPEAMSVKS